MNINEVLIKQNVITKILLKDGNKELPKELKVKIMRIRMAYSKIKKNFDADVQDFVKEYLISEVLENEELKNEFNENYLEFLKQKSQEEVDIQNDFFTLDEYSEIVEVNVGNDVDINGKMIKAPDFLEIVYDMFVKEI